MCEEDEIVLHELDWGGIPMWLDDVEELRRRLDEALRIPANLLQGKPEEKDGN